MMATEFNNSPYLQPLASSSVDQGALGYSRHYARRMRDMGKANRESWIKKLWSHMFTRKKETEERIKQRAFLDSYKKGGKTEDGGTSDREKSGERTDRNSSTSASSSKPVQLPPLNNNSSSPSGIKREVTFAGRQLRDSISRHSTNSHSENKSSHTLGPREHSHVRSAPPRSRESQRPKSVVESRTMRDKHQLLPMELSNSPYLPKDKGNHKWVMMERQKELNRMKEPQYKERRGGSEVQRKIEPVPPSKPRHADYSHVSNHVDSWRQPRYKGVSMAELEERAKKAVSKAVKSNKIFTCDVPYPMDAYVRWSLRQRGWVEKFSNTVHNNASRASTSNKLEMELDEDFETVCEQAVPNPWEEDHGIYTIMSRLVRHYPARFIWGGRGVNNLVLRNEVIVNHFTKARYFSSKNGITQSLRELMWYIDGDSQDFFPRCYMLSEDEKDDIFEDYRMTACMGILKYVVQRYTKEQEKVTEEKVVKKEKVKEKVTEDDPIKETCIGMLSKDMQAEQDRNNQQNEENNRKTSEEGVKVDENGNSEETEESEKMESASDNIAQKANQNIPPGDSSVKPSKDNGEEEDNDVSMVTAQGAEQDVEKEPKPEDCEEEGASNSSGTETKNKESNDSDSKSGEKNEMLEKKVFMPAPTKEYVVPEIQRANTSTGRWVPSKAVDWAINQLDRFVRFKTHEDLDAKKYRMKPALMESQWTELCKWYQQLVHDEGKVKVSKSKVEECQKMLLKMRDLWSQFDIDGMRNIWIIKPSAKSKGIGICFCHKLEDMMKYIENSTVTGSYVVQKYIERPLLIYNCKFDMRQWFLVTDWNPLTIWFYKDCYLRICSQEFSYTSMHEAVHLSNVAIQQFYINGKRSDKLPDNNYMDSNDFQQYLAEVGAPTAWDDIIYPGMKQAIIHTLVSTIDITETRKSAFELYGADFMMSEDFRPWLLEINSSPGMAPSSVEKARLCATVIEDTVKVVLDVKDNKNADTGRFELAFKDSPQPPFRCVDSKIYLRGTRLKRSQLEKLIEVDKVATEKEAEKIKKEKKKKREEEEKKKQIEEENRRKEEENAEKCKIEKDTGDGEEDEVEEDKDEGELAGLKVKDIINEITQGEKHKTDNKDEELEGN